ncbi:hypothetical protein R6Z07M_016747 [Ovis aries]
MPPELEYDPKNQASLSEQLTTMAKQPTLQLNMLCYFPTCDISVTEARRKFYPALIKTRTLIKTPKKKMAITRVPILGLFITVLISLQESWAIKEDHVIIQAEFYLNPEESAEFMFDFDGDEIFHVDMQKKETVWRLPEFGRFASFEAQGALANMAVMKANLDIMIKRSNNTPNTNVPPEVTLLPNKPVELGEPNTLICFTDKFSPPVISVTWLRNGIPVTDGVSQTVFLPRDDHLFRKFHYLPFLPTTEDVYDCKVEHWGLNEPLLKHWEYEAPAPLPETTENAPTLLKAEGLCEAPAGNGLC